MGTTMREEQQVILQCPDCSQPINLHVGTSGLDAPSRSSSALSKVLILLEVRIVFSGTSCEQTLQPTRKDSPEAEGIQGPQLISFPGDSTQPG